MTKDDYLARVPDVADREVAAAAYEAMNAADAAVRQARGRRWQEEQERTPEQKAAMEALESWREQSVAAIESEFAAKAGEILGPDSVIALEHAAEAAASAYDAAPGGSVMEDDENEDRVRRCALSGAPLWAGDEVVEIHGKTILACVLLSPEQIAALAAGSDGEADEDDTDDEIEDAA